MANQERFSHRLIKARRERGLSQIEAADRIGITQQGLQRLESEKNKRALNILEIASGLEVCPYWLQFGESSKCRCCMR